MERGNRGNAVSGEVEMVRRSSGWILVVALALATSLGEAADKKKGNEQEFSVEELCRKNFQTGQEYLKNQRYLDAKESFTLVVEACPEDADAHRQLGLTCLTMREYQLAAESFEKARALRPDDLDLKVNQAITYSYLARNDQTMADKALSLYLEVLEADPTRAGVYQNVGQIYAGQGKMAESIMMNMQALTLSADTADAELPEPQARDWLTAKVFPQAYAFFKNRTERDTLDLGSLRILAYFYYRTKLFKPAIDAYETILAKEPESATALNEHKILSDALKKAGRFDDAVQHLEFVIDKEPDVMNNYYNLSGYYKDKNDFGRAVAIADKGLARNGNWGCLWYAKGEVKEAQAKARQDAKAYDESIALYEEAKALFSRAVGDSQCGANGAKQVERQDALIKRVKAIRDKEAQNR